MDLLCIVSPYISHPFHQQWEHRVFHAATHIGGKMVVIGGLTKTGSLAKDILVFRYNCSTWHRIGLDRKDIFFKGLFRKYFVGCFFFWCVCVWGEEGGSFSFFLLFHQSAGRKIRAFTLDLVDGGLKL